MNQIIDLVKISFIIFILISISKVQGKSLLVQGTWTGNRQESAQLQSGAKLNKSQHAQEKESLMTTTKMADRETIIPTNLNSYFLNSSSPPSSAIARQEELAFVATGSDVADSALKITGFVFKFLSQTVQSIFGKNGINGALQTAVDFQNPDSKAQLKSMNANSGKCIKPGKYTIRPKQEEQEEEETTTAGTSAQLQDLRSAELIDDDPPSPSLTMYNLLDNHAAAAAAIQTLFKNPAETTSSKLLGVVAIVSSKNRIIPLVANAVDLKLLKIETSKQNDQVGINYVGFKEEHEEELGNAETNQSSKKNTRQENVEDVMIDSPVAETTLEVTKYIFGYLTQTVTSVFGTGAEPSKDTKTPSTDPNKKNPTKLQPCLKSSFPYPRSDQLQLSNQTSLNYSNYFDKLFSNISEEEANSLDEQQKLIGIIAIVTKDQIVPIVVNAVDLDFVEQNNPLETVFRNWDRIGEGDKYDGRNKIINNGGPAAAGDSITPSPSPAAGDSITAPSPSPSAADNVDDPLKILNLIQTLRKQNPWLLPKVF